MIGGIGGSGLNLISRNPYAAVTRIPAVNPAPQTSQLSAFQVDRLRSVHGDIVKALRSLGDLQETMAIRPSKVVADRVELASSSPLSLNIVATPTTLSSVEEVNATPTSFTPFGPSFAGSSTSEPTIGGTYTGTTDETLTFEVRRGGTVGSSRMRFRVKDGAGNVIDNVLIPTDTPSDTVFALSTGLTVSFSSGALTKNDTFTVDVSASVGSAVDPNKPFDGVRNDNPGLELGTSVTDGSFEVNGTSVAVNASDTLQDVVDRITATVPDVTAVFDAATERLLLNRETPGAAPDIAIGSDTSGFVAATKLDAASAVPGLDDERVVAMSSVAAFAGVSAGTLQVNGRSIAIDPTSDSLEDVLASVSGASTGVTASFDEGAMEVRLRADVNGTAIELDDGGTGFFAAIGIDAGLHEPDTPARLSPRAHRLHIASRAAEDLRGVKSTINRIFSRLGGSALQGSSTARTMLSVLADTVREAFGADEDATRVRSPFGLRFDLSDGAKELFSFDQQEQRAFRTTFGRGDQATRTFLLGSNQSDGPRGFVEAMTDALQVFDQKLRSEFGSTGVLFSGVA